MQRRVELPEIPEIGNGDMLFTLKDITYTPEMPRMNEPFTVKGKVVLLKIPFITPIWVIVSVVYPETWWEQIIPLLGAPQVREMAMAIGGNFEVVFKTGFIREGEFALATRLYAGPTIPIDKLTLPPLPPVATEETTFTVSGEVPPEKLDFELTRPSPSQTYIDPGTEIDITCPITSRCTMAVDARAKVTIYQGSFLPLHGDKVKEYDSDVFHIEPDETKNVIIHHRTIKGTIDRRDVAVEVYVAGKLVKGNEWDDVYYVGIPPEELIDFALARPSVSPATITPGMPITITCPVTSACAKEQTVTVKCLIYAGSILPLHGDLIKTYTSPAFSISPGESYNVKVSHTAVASTIDRRDVGVEVYITGKLVKEDEWDDVYYVTPGPPPPKEAPEIQTLAASNITHSSATLNVQLTKEGFCSVINCYIEWGKTTAYGFKSPEYRLYPYPDPRSELHVDISVLEPGTTYHFRAVAVGRCVTPELVGYGTDMTFTTGEEVVIGFTMRVINPRAGATQWRAGSKYTIYPYMKYPEPLNYIWEWTGPVPDMAVDFFIIASGPWEDGYAPTIQYDGFPFRLRAGKNYVWDFAAHEMRDDGKVWPPY